MREYIIVGGNTNSPDYAPAANDHAFMYAVDYEGNWRWGKFFYNESYAISTISGCQIDDNGNIIIMGMSNSYPIVMEISIDDGAVYSFASIGQRDQDPANMPRYVAFAAAHHDVRDKFDGNSYLYTAFLMDEYLQIVKILKQGKDMSVVWSY